MKDKKNMVFGITVLLFLIVVIIAKLSYEDMQKQEIKKLSNGKWYACDEDTFKNLGNLEIQFKEDETFDIYQSDTQVSCMSGKYVITYKGMVYLKSEESGFNPPKGWKCGKKAWFKYKINDDKLYFKHDKVEGVFGIQGENSQKKTHFL